MEGKEAIVKSIISSAKLTADNIIGDAEAEAKEIIDKVRRELELKGAAAEKSSLDTGADIVRRKITLAELDARKITLANKQMLIDEVYSDAVRKFSNMTDNVYREFIGGFVYKYAEDNDEVIIAEKDEKRLNREWIAQIAKKMGIHLVKSLEYHTCSGGVILNNNAYDKNLTLETLVKEARPLTESSVAKRLFDVKDN